MWNGNSSFGFDKAMSFNVDGNGRDLPLWFRLTMPIPPMLVSGL